MKHTILKWLMSVILVTTPLTVLAQGRKGFPIRALGEFPGRRLHFADRQPPFTPGAPTTRLDDLEGPGDTNQTIAGMASIFLRYQFENGTAVYAGNPLEPGEDFILTAGVSQPLDNGTLDVSMIWIPGNSVWENPYQTVESRDKTDAEAYGLRAKWQEIAGTTLGGFL